MVQNKKNLILFLNGPNLGLLGIRQPHIYGTTTLKESEECLQKKAASYELRSFQSDQEGELVSFLGRHFRDEFERLAGIILNPGAFAHTSIALRDALSLFGDIPIYEVHLSNVYARESFRHHSYCSAVVTGVICGLGGLGYELALEAILQSTPQ